MRKILTILFTGLSLFVHAQQTEVRKINAKPTGISISTGIQAKIVKSNKNVVVLDAQNQSQLDKIETKVEKGILIIRVKRNSNIQNSRNLNATVYINPSLSSIEISSAGYLEIIAPLDVRILKIDLSTAGALKTNKISTGKMSIDASSAAKFASNNIKVNELIIEASSASSILLAGSSNKTSIEAITNAHVNTAKVRTKSVSAQARTGAKIKVQASDSFHAIASSGGSITYTGYPKKTNFEKSSGGTINNAN